MFELGRINASLRQLLRETVAERREREAKWNRADHIDSGRVQHSS
jgi:hypothetical protein